MSAGGAALLPPADAVPAGRNEAKERSEDLHLSLSARSLAARVGNHRPSPAHLALHTRFSRYFRRRVSPSYTVLRYPVMPMLRRCFSIFLAILWLGAALHCSVTLALARGNAPAPHCRQMAAGRSGGANHGSPGARSPAP